MNLMIRKNIFSCLDANSEESNSESILAIDELFSE